MAPGGAGCPADLAARLTLLPMTERNLRALVGALPGGCAVLGVRLPQGATPVAITLEAEQEGSGFVPCQPGLECPAAGSYFLGAPVKRKGAAGTIVLVAFHSVAGLPRRAALAVETAP